MEYFLDPDFRRDPKRNPDGSFVCHCVRCQKTIKDPSKAIKVRVNWDNWMVRQDETGKELMGTDCWKVITSKK